MIDPMAEEDRRTTPYSYTFDDPIRHTDPDGMFGEDANDCGCPTPPCGGVSAPVKITFGVIFGGSVGIGAGMVTGGIITGPGEVVIVPAAVVVVIVGAAAGGLVAGWNAITSSSAHDPLNGGDRLPPEQIQSPPKKPGNAPIGLDGHPVELHHREQGNPNTPLDEMSRQDHRGGDNYKKNHTNTGQESSNVNKTQHNQNRKKHWKKEHDSGRFNNDNNTTPQSAPANPTPPAPATTSS